MHPRLHLWHVFFGLFYAALVVWAAVWLTDTGRLASWISVWDFVLMTLAIFRLTRLFVYDHVTGFIRNWFAGHDPYTFLGTCGTLINCPWCLGLWFALVVPFAFFATPYAWFPIFVLAIAALATSLQLLANLIGWSAEAKKREAQGTPLPR